MKTVVYSGIAYVVPDWVNCIAVDEDGAGTGFQSSPYCEIDRGLWFTYDASFELGAVKIEQDWKKSLVKV